MVVKAGLLEPVGQNSSIALSNTRTRSSFAEVGVSAAAMGQQYLM